MGFGWGFQVGDGNRFELYNPRLPSGGPPRYGHRGWKARQGFLSLERAGRMGSRFFGSARQQGISVSSYQEEQ